MRQKNKATSSSGYGGSRDRLVGPGSTNLVEIPGSKVGNIIQQICRLPAAGMRPAVYPLHV